jgi:dipeptidyl aminopeptidase/acylaminoacyl peptidase
MLIRSRLLRAVCTMVLLGQPMSSPAQAGEEAVPHGSGRAVDVQDLMALRDIGTLHASADEQIFSLSPDGTRIAFQVRQADAAANTYRLTMYILALRPGALPVVVDQGGEYMKDNWEGGGFAVHIPSGASAVITPVWSPDGKQIAYLRRDNGVTQAWVADAAGGGARAATHVGYDIEGVAWTEDGRALVVTGRPGLLQAAEDLKGEGKSGFVFDDRFVPFAGSYPQIPSPVASATFLVNLETGELAIATSAQAARLRPPPVEGYPTLASHVASLPTGERAWSEPEVKDDVSAPTRITIKRPRHALVSLTVKPHDEISSLFWSPDGRTLYVLKRDGWGLSFTSLYAWHSGLKELHAVFNTRDMLIGCEFNLDRLICGHEASTQPRELVSVDVATGAISKVYDPNPDFAALRKGSVHRLEWTNAYGVQSYGDLVLPPDHVPGQKHPLIVVQYQTRGFLRGGTGDEYPIQALAGRGYAILSFQGPMSVSYVTGAKSWEEANRQDFTHWKDRRSIQSSLDKGIDLVLSTGVADADRIGISGLSDGAATTIFALIHNNRYKAASLGSCCMEPSVTGFLTGARYRRQIRSWGLPALTDEADAFWAHMSLRANTAHMDTPILAQVADVEFPAALEGVVALQEKQKPIETYVVPDENHILWQSAHRLAVYRRNIAWFDYWLRDVRDPSPDRTADYKLWDALPRAPATNLRAAPGP